MNKMSLGKKGLDALKKAEGFVPNLYNDGGKTKGYCTIGYGHLVHYDPCDVKSFKSEEPFVKGISETKAEALMKTDYNFAENAVNELVKVNLNQNQFDALVMFVFNVGRGAFSRSSLLKSLNAGNYNVVPAELRKWNKSNGKVMKGLTNRRNVEIAIFNAEVDK